MECSSLKKAGNLQYVISRHLLTPTNCTKNYSFSIKYWGPFDIRPKGSTQIYIMAQRQLKQLAILYNLMFESSDPHDNLLLQCSTKLRYLYKRLTFCPDEGLRVKMSAIYINIPILQNIKEEDCLANHSTRMLFIKNNKKIIYH